MARVPGFAGTTVTGLEYRAYMIGPDGHIQERFDLPNTREAEAMEQAKSLADGHDVELWLGTEKIAKFTHKH